ncbi:MAG: DUF4097 family beta strand repeat-containing protein [Gemmatimonadetes bacterium]|nr:DUF4097 family beta strand repeat-containing protein [Candidatus Palauibacter rhopaloidicola]
MGAATVVLTATALVATSPGARDTTFVVPEGARIEIEHREGDIRVMGAASREARIVLDDDDGRILVQSSGGTIRLGSSPSGDGADFLLYLPEDVDVSVVGHEGDVTVAGIVRGTVTVRTADGDVEIDGGASVSIATLDGSVRISNTGAATVSVTDGDVWLDQVAGAMSISGIDADIIVTNADTRAISVATVDGDVWYDGALHGDGTYSLSTHDGDVTFAVPENAGARISVSTFDGELEPSFPVQFQGGGVRGGQFTVGDGSAEVTLKSFDGDILLVRPGERTPDLDSQEPTR